MTTWHEAVRALIEPADPYYRGVHRAADTSKPKIKRLFKAAIDAWADRAPSVDDLVKVLHGGGATSAAESAIELLGIGALGVALRSALGDTIAATTLAGARVAAIELQDALASRRNTARQSPRGNLSEDLSYVFDAVNPAAVDAARELVGNFITQMTETQKEAIRGLVARAFEEGRPPVRLAEDILDFGLGLTDGQVQAVEKFRAGLVGKGVDADAVDRRTDRYYEAQLSRRAETIARTETMSASNLGSELLWDQAAEAGLFERTTAQQEFICTPDERLCEQCEPFDGTLVDFGEEFADGNPPLHPACRCVVSLIVGD